MKKFCCTLITLTLFGLFFASESFSMAPGGRKRPAPSHKKGAARAKRVRQVPVAPVAEVRDLAVAVTHNNGNPFLNKVVHADVLPLVMRYLDAPSCGQLAQASRKCAMIMNEAKPHVFAPFYKNFSLDPILKCLYDAERAQNPRLKEAACIIRERDEPIRGIRGSYCERRGNVEFSPWHCWAKDCFMMKAINVHPELRAKLTLEEVQNCAQWHMVNLTHSMPIAACKVVLDHLASEHQGEPIVVFVQGHEIDNSENGLAKLLTNYPVFVLRCTDCSISSLEEVSKLTNLRELYLNAIFAIAEDTIQEEFARLGTLHNLAALTVQSKHGPLPLREIPASWVQLKNLQYFDMRQSDLVDNYGRPDVSGHYARFAANGFAEIMPIQGIGRIENLRVLLLTDHRPIELSRCQKLQTLEMRCARADLRALRLPKLEQLSLVVEGNSGNLLQDDVRYAYSLQNMMTAIQHNLPELCTLCIFPIELKATDLRQMLNHVANFTFLRSFFINCSSQSIGFKLLSDIADSRVKKFGVMGRPNAFSRDFDVLYFTPAQIKPLLAVRSCPEELKELLTRVKYLKALLPKVWAKIGQEDSVFIDRCEKIVNCESLLGLFDNPKARVVAVDSLITSVCCGKTSIEEIASACVNLPNVNRRLKLLEWKCPFVDSFKNYLKALDVSGIPGSDSEICSSIVDILQKVLPLRSISVQDAQSQIVGLIVPLIREKCFYGAEVLQSDQKFVSGVGLHITQCYFEWMFGKFIVACNQCMIQELLVNYRGYIRKQSFHEMAASSDDRERAVAHECLRQLDAADFLRAPVCTL